MSNLSRRSLVASAASLPALAVPAVAVAASAEPDPVYTLIEAHRRAYQTWSDAVDVQFGLRRDDPRLPAAEAETERLGVVKEGRFYDLSAASPTTVAGVAALLDHICDIHALCESEFCKDTLVVTMGNIALMLRELAVQS
jgi:hypothetical protein